MRELKRYLAALLCLMMILTGTFAVAEEGAVTEAPAAETATPEPTAEPTAEPTPEATEEPEEEISGAAEAEPVTIEFDEDELSYALSEIGEDFDYAEEFALTIENAEGAELVWSTSDPDIADFVAYDRDGKVIDPDDLDGYEADEFTIIFEAYEPGRVKVRAALAEDAGVYGEFLLTVTEDADKAAAEPVLAVDQTALTLTVGGTATLAATLTVDGAPVAAEITWASDSEHATFENGAVTAVSKGTANITASCTYEGIPYTATCVVTVENPALTGIAVDSPAFYSDETKVLTVSPVPAGATLDPAQITYEIAPGSEGYITLAGATVGAVTADGLLNTTETSVTAKVKVTYGEFTAESTVTVYQAATAIEIEGGEASVWLGKTAALGVQVSPANAHDVVKSYATSSAATFTIDTAGTITGAALGEAYALVEMESGKTVSFKVVVKQGTDALAISVLPGKKHIGTAEQLSVVRTPATATDEIAWDSLNPEIATVDETGLVTYLSPGQVTITATSEAGATAFVTLTVIRPATAIRLYDDVFSGFQGLILAQNQPMTPVISLLPKDATDQSFTMESSDTSIASIYNGKIYPMNRGDAVITVKSGDGAVSRTFKVRVIANSQSMRSLKLSKTSLSIKEGSSYTLKATINSGAYSKTVQWGTADPTIATVSSKGVVKGVKPGTAYVYAMLYSGVAVRVTVTIQPILPSSVKLSKSSITLYPDATYGLKATLSPSKIPQPENRVVKWSTSSTKVAVVNDSGLVFGMSPGTAYITAKTVNGKSYRCKVVVKPRLVTKVDVTNPYGDLLVGGTYTLDCAVSPGNATNRAVTWAFSSSSYKNYATINASTGEIVCKKVGTIKVTATAKDGSRKTDSITLKIVSVPLVSFEVKQGDDMIDKDEIIELAYGNSFTAVAAVVPALYTEWTTSNARVASVKDGLVTATGAGSAKITVTAGGLYAYSFTVNVPRDDSLPTYRALVIGQYQSSSASGYLPFSKNSTYGVCDALQESVIGGQRYSVTYKSNLTSASQLTDAIASKFSDAKENDVSVIYLLSHGTMSNGTYRWHLSDSGSSSYVTGDQIVAAMKNIKGNVVLVIASCYSGGDDANDSSVPGLVKAADRASGEGTSYSMIGSSDGMQKSSYANFAEARAYDFFSYAFAKSLGWNLITDSAVSMAADADSDGYVTVSELASTAKTITADEVAAFLKTYGSSGYFGPASKTQLVTYYVSPDAASLPIFGE